MGFGEVVGQESVKQALRRAVASGRVAHAYLFTGPAGLGQVAVARNLAKALNCREGRDGEPCDACHQCRQIEAGSHPDVRWLAPEGNSLKIGQMRALLREACLKPFTGRWRVIVIQEAEKLTTEAANSLLKGLEDPPADVVWILIARGVEGLLPTVVSRCQGVFFRPVAQEAVIGSLRRDLGLPEEEARLLAVLSRGNPARAREMAASTEVGEVRRLARETVRRLWASTEPGGAWVAFEVAQALETWKGRGIEILDLLSWVYRDLLIQELGADELLTENLDGDGETPVLPVGLALAGLREIETARRRLRSNGHRRLVFEVLTHQLRAGFCQAII